MSLANFEQQTVLRQVQKAVAVAKAIRIAASYPDDRLDIADAVAGLVIVLEGATAMLDPSGCAP